MKRCVERLGDFRESSCKLKAAIVAVSCQHYSTPFNPRSPHGHLCLLIAS